MAKKGYQHKFASPGFVKKGKWSPCVILQYQMSSAVPFGKNLPWNLMVCFLNIAFKHPWMYTWHWNKLRIRYNLCFFSSWTHFWLWYSTILEIWDARPMGIIRFWCLPLTTFSGFSSEQHSCHPTSTLINLAGGSKQKPGLWPTISQNFAREIISMKIMISDVICVILKDKIWKWNKTCRSKWFLC